VKLDAVYEFGITGLEVARGLMGQRVLAPDGLWLQFPAVNERGLRTENRQLFSNDDPVGIRSVQGYTISYTINSVVLGFPVEVEIVELPVGYQERTAALATLNLHELLLDHEPRAQRVFDRLTDLLRSDLNHAWLSSRAAVAPARAVRAGFFDADGERLPYGVGTIPGGVSLRMGTDSLLKAADLDEFVATAHSDGDLPLAPLFIADAASAHDVKHGVVLAAIGCEIAVKAALKAGATGEQGALVELLLDHPRDFSVAAASLYDRPCKIVLGTSLKEHDRDLFKDIEQLFHHRNRIVHRGLSDLSDTTTLANDIGAASKAVRWVESLL
jgi:hypothetical protein